MAKTELETLMVTIEADLKRYSKQMQQFGQMTDGTFKKAKAAADTSLGGMEQRANRAGVAMATAMEASTKSSRQFQARLQQVGYQVGDFFVQLEGGQGIVRALTQQGSQVLGAFGPMGAIIGAVGTAFGALITILASYESTADLAKASTEAFSEAQKALGGVLDENEQKLSKAKDSLSLLQLGYSGLARLTLTDAIRKNNAAITTSFEEIKTAGDWSYVKRTLDAMYASAAKTGQKLPEGLQSLRKAMGELGSTTTPTIQQMESFVVTLQSLQGSTPHAEQRIDGLLAAVTPLIPKLKAQADEQRALDEMNRKFTASGGKASTAVEILGTGFVNAIIPAVKFGDAIGGVTDKLDAMEKAKPTFSMDLGAGGLSFAGGKAPGGQIPGAFSSVDIGNVEEATDPYSKAMNADAPKTKEIEAYTAAQEALNGVLSESGEEYLKARNELSLLEQGYGELANLALAAAVEENNKKITASFEKLTNDKQFQALNDLVASVSSQIKQFGDDAPASLAPLNAAMTALLTSSTPTLAQLQDFIVAADGFAREYPPATDAVTGMKSAVLALLPELKKASDEHRTLSEQSQALAGSAGQAATATKVLGFGFIDAIAPAIRFGDAIQGVTDKLDAMSRAKPTFSLDKKQGLSFGAGPGAGGQIPGAFASVDIGNVEAPKDPYFDALFNPDKDKKKSGGGAPKMSKEDRAALKEENALIADAKRLYEEVRTPAEVYFAAVAEATALKPQLITLLGSEASANETVSRAVTAAGEAYDKATKAAAEAKDKTAEYGKAIASAFDGAITSADSFLDALQNIALKIIELSAQGLFGQGSLGGLFNSLLGVTANGILGSAATSGLPGAIGGGAIKAWPARSSASGGAAGPGPVLVGEAGPELLNMGSRGFVSPSNATRRLMSGGGGNGPVNVVVTGATTNSELQSMIAIGIANGMRNAGRNVPKIQQNYQIRYA